MNSVTNGVVRGVGLSEEGSRAIPRFLAKELSSKRKSWLAGRGIVWDKWHLSGLVRDVQEAVDPRV